MRAVPVACVCVGSLLCLVSKHCGVGKGWASAWKLGLVSAVLLRVVTPAMSRGAPSLLWLLGT